MSWGKMVSEIVILNRYHCIYIFCFFAEKTMRKLKIESHYNSSELKEIMDSQSSVRAFQNWQIIYLAQINPEKNAQDISTFLGIKVSKVHRIVQTL